MGSLARAGYRLPANFSTPRVQLGSYGHQLFDRQTPDNGNFSAQAFAGVRATLTAHDITLDGPLFRTFETGVKSEPLKGEFLYGVGLRYHNIELVYSQTLRSKEFSQQNNSLEFGSFVLRFQSGF